MNKGYVLLLTKGHDCSTVDTDHIHLPSDFNDGDIYAWFHGDAEDDADMASLFPIQRLCWPFWPNSYGQGTLVK